MKRLLISLQVAQRLTIRGAQEAQWRSNILCFHRVKKYIRDIDSTSFYSFFILLIVLLCGCKTTISESDPNDKDVILFETKLARDTDDMDKQDIVRTKQTGLEPETKLTQ